MPTNAQFAAQLLRSAAKFFRDIGQQNPTLMEQMDQNAQSFEAVADLVEADPTGPVPVETPPG